MRRESEREQPDYDGLYQQWINDGEEGAVVAANELKQASLVFRCRPLLVGLPFTLLPDTAFRCARAEIRSQLTLRFANSSAVLRAQRMGRCLPAVPP